MATAEKPRKTQQRPSRDKQVDDYLSSEGELYSDEWEPEPPPPPPRRRRQRQPKNLQERYYDDDDDERYYDSAGEKYAVTPYGRKKQSIFGPTGLSFEREEPKPDKDEDDGLRLRLDLNIEIEVELRARIHGDLTLALIA